MPNIMGAARFAVTLRYHRTLDDRLDDLEECFLLFESDAQHGRAAFVTAAIRFAEFEKAHFEDEDEHLFSVALSILRGAELERDRPESLIWL